MTNNSTSGWARFWAIDFHVHTPGSADAAEENYGTPADIVAAARAAGLDAIAITDHNTATWCDQVVAAAEGSGLVVLPGVEISTTEGHLLAIFEEGTTGAEINELLVRLNIRQADQGKLDIAADVGIIEASKEVAAAGGLAVAAHIDKPKGLLQLGVAAHLRKTLLEESLSALEFVKSDTPATVDGKLQGERQVAYVQGSDTWDASASTHALSGIGARRTWIKASRPDLIGIRHALADPELRITLSAPLGEPVYPVIDRVELVGGFLDGQYIKLCPDLNCLLGGTGAGKSLFLEAIRYGLDQQVDREAFPAIGEEVYSRLQTALGAAGLVRIQFHADGCYYRVERAFAPDGTRAPTVMQQSGDDWIAVDTAPDALVRLAAFSQGEVLEYSRQPVGRMSLIDAGINLELLDPQIDKVKGQLASNAADLLAARRRTADLQTKTSREAELDEQVRELAKLFETDVVKQQEAWQRESGALTAVIERVSGLNVPELTVPPLKRTGGLEANDELFVKAEDAVTNLQSRFAEVRSDLTQAIQQADSALRGVQREWTGRYAVFKQKLDAELERVNPGSSLTSLRSSLESLQAKLVEVLTAKEELNAQAIPGHERLVGRREELLEELHRLRAARRDLRRERVAELNQKTAGFVKLDVPAQGDFTEFRRSLNSLKVGSRVREDVLDAIARTVHPFRFVRALLGGDVNSLINLDEGIDAASVARLLANIDEKELWNELLELQVIERPDTLTVKFKKPDDGSYTSIENLAHGQRCTAILVVLLADGNTPVLVDQPEDALHAPWIEDYLVDRLRKLRGTRQYIFATRSPGIVVSGDAEQIITMRATAGKGEVEACGSLERHDLNKLALHHLEGGPVPFNRRTQKLMVSTQVER